ncbi:glycosyltransferase family 4 protein [Deinococcus knuensis]|uniref:Glycosyltransferase WbuB n=1 Tax=Deinococcus knuensis TaxID=1837380 RepID=A0ABQ2SEN8_9DEIO|nr:glycosyltransferase family 4 protein [Deinococcus knuensis]GGS26106.1 glycosyltransferase WbuB [Deinococcus knuensis]
MRILINDYTGYAFPYELSCYLASMGHEIIHCYCESINIPQGSIKSTEKLRVFPITLSRRINKKSFVSRLFLEREYGSRSIEIIKQTKPDIVISGNMPIDSQALIIDYCNKNSIRTIHWWQDIYGVAIRNILTKRNRVIGKIIGDLYIKREMSCISRADAVIGITEDFENILKDHRVSTPFHVIHNWAPIKDLPKMEKENDWSIKNGFDSSFNIIYSGTLSMKHDPNIILRLAQKLETLDGIKIIIISEGDAPDYISRQAEKMSLKNINVLPFQKYELLPKVLATADCLLVLLEPEASEFSVPSKILAYACAGRPILASMPEENLSTKIISRNRFGLNSGSGDVDLLFNHAHYLFKNSEESSNMGKRARLYAEETFKIDIVAAKFLKVIQSI